MSENGLTGMYMIGITPREEQAPNLYRVGLRVEPGVYITHTVNPQTREESPEGALTALDAEEVRLLHGRQWAMFVYPTLDLALQEYEELFGA